MGQSRSSIHNASFDSDSCATDNAVNWLPELGECCHSGQIVDVTSSNLHCAGKVELFLISLILKIITCVLNDRI